jgi:site-specific DNA-methyltransferase (adenine-specific)
MNSYFCSGARDFELYHDNCFELMPKLTRKFNLIFADPPYFLSNDGLSIQSGQIVSVNKGEWDRRESDKSVRDFNAQWISLAKECLEDDGTIFVCGSFHNIFSVGVALEELGFTILNVITWEKSNPPPCFSKRFFTFSSEFIIWAKKSKTARHCFNYELMKEANGGRQMKDVWNLPAIAPWEKTNGKHPTQKPLSLLVRLIAAASKPGDLVLDPFAGSSTTGIASVLLGRHFVGIESELNFCQLSQSRYNEIQDTHVSSSFRHRLAL